MTIAMFMLATCVRTPGLLWMTAMVCDTVIVVTFIALHKA
jgi:hypothetical protein